MTFMIALLTLVFIAGLATESAYAEQKKTYTLDVSIYAGWMPWYYANETGILKKWADKYGITINVSYKSYPGSLESFVAGQSDACVMTNMEQLDMPAAAGIDCEAIILGDYSNGNDGICLRGVSSIVGQNVYLVQGTVSHYLLYRYLKTNGRSLRDVKIVNTSDEAIVSGFMTDPGQTFVATWNPLLMQIQQLPGVKTVFTSAQTPGEIMDLMVVRKDALDKNPDFGRALVGCWYEVMGIMTQRGPVADKAMTAMAKLAGCSLTEFKAQLATTFMYYTPADAYAFMMGSEIQQKMDLVRNFCFAQKLLGEGVSSVDFLGIQYPGGVVQGDKKNVKMRFNATFTREAMEGKLK